jgi:hypothetical protein
MKNSTIILILLTALVSVHSSAQITLIWENDTIARTPESIVYDSLRECCYISNFNKSNGNGTNYNEDYISRFNLKGQLLERKMIPNLSSPTGLCLFKDKLFIVERFGIVVYDLEQNKIETRYRLNSGKFLNDVTVDFNDNIYVTVSDTNIIYRISDGKVEKWIESNQISNPNAIICDGDKIIVGVCAENSLKSISIADKNISTIAIMGNGLRIIDGLKKYGNDYLISHFEGNIVLVHKNGEFTELLNTQKQGISIADMEYIVNQRLFIIPDLNNSKVLLYKFENNKYRSQ